MKKLCLFLILTTLIFAGCSQNQSSQAGSAGGQAPGGFSPPTAPKNGPSDGGGGIGQEGKPLESFRVDITTLPEFKEQILPVLKKLEISFPEFAADLWHIALDRTWYIIPGPIKKLPAFEMGVSFIDFDQLAYQNLQETWIDMRMYQNKMQQDDRAKLLMHELLIGVRILEFSDSLDLCLSQARTVTFSEKTADQYKAVSKGCYKTYGRWGAFKPNGHLKMDERDYAFVRKLGPKLLTDESVLEADGLKEQMEAAGFRDYGSNDNN